MKSSLVPTVFHHHPSKPNFGQWARIKTVDIKRVYITSSNFGEKSENASSMYCIERILQAVKPDHKFLRKETIFTWGKFTGKLKCRSTSSLLTHS